MSQTNTADIRVAVIGLGYVGLPLAISLARHFPTVGYDVSASRIEELRAGRDRTREIERDTLRESRLRASSAPADIAGMDLYIVTVPTPVDARNEPDLGPLRGACETVGAALRKGAVVVFESTVYPGVTEDICGPALERASGLRCGSDFHLGYSPERINPGDRENTIDRLIKVIAGQTPEVTELLARVYGAVTSGGVFRAASIRTAEAAKVIENAQRDINIAFINEVTMIFDRLGLSIYDVLDASYTKWNFLKFQPGLVGGHCIGVDPFYLARCAQDAGHHPEIILAGRRINDGMGPWLAERISGGLPSAARVLVLGLTFKENVPDLRNSKVADLIRRLRELKHEVLVHDALADAADAKREYGERLIASLDSGAPYDCVVGAVPHREYVELTGARLAGLLRTGGLVADVKGMWRRMELPATLRQWRP